MYSDKPVYHRVNPPPTIVLLVFQLRWGTSQSGSRLNIRIIQNPGLRRVQTQGYRSLENHLSSIGHQLIPFPLRCLGPETTRFPHTFQLSGLRPNFQRFNAESTLQGPLTLRYRTLSTEKHRAVLQASSSLRSERQPDLLVESPKLLLEENLSDFLQRPHQLVPPAPAGPLAFRTQAESPYPCLRCPRELRERTPRVRNRRVFRRAGAPPQRPGSRRCRRTRSTYSRDS